MMKEQPPALFDQRPQAGHLASALALRPSGRAMAIDRSLDGTMADGARTVPWGCSAGGSGPQHLGRVRRGAPGAPRLCLQARLGLVQDLLQRVLDLLAGLVHARSRSSIEPW